MRTRWLPLAAIVAICVIGWWWWSAAADDSGPGDVTDRPDDAVAIGDAAAQESRPGTNAESPAPFPSSDEPGRVAVETTLTVVAAESGLPIASAQVECVDRVGVLRSTHTSDAHGQVELPRGRGFDGLVVWAEGRQRLAFEPGVTRVELPVEVAMAVEVKTSQAILEAFEFVVEPAVFVAAGGGGLMALLSLRRARDASGESSAPTVLGADGRGTVPRPVDVAGGLALGARHRFADAHAQVALVQFARDARSVVFDLGERTTFSGVILRLPAPTVEVTACTGTLVPPYGDKVVRVDHQLAAGTHSIPFLVLPGSAGTAELGSVRIGSGASRLALENFEVELIENQLVDLAPWSSLTGASLDVVIEGLDPADAARVELALQPARIDPSHPQFAYRLTQTGPLARRFDALTASGLHRIELAPEMRDLGFFASAVAVDITPGVVASDIVMPVERHGNVRVLLPTSPGDLVFESVADGELYERRVAREDISLRLPVGRYRVKFRADANGLERRADVAIVAPEPGSGNTTPGGVVLSLQ